MATRRAVLLASPVSMETSVTGRRCPSAYHVLMMGNMTSLESWLLGSGPRSDLGSDLGSAGHSSPPSSPPQRLARQSRRGTCRLKPGHRHPHQRRGRLRLGHRARPRQTRRTPHTRSAHPLFLVLSGLATGLSWLCYFRALQLGPASRVAPLDKLSVPLVMVFAWLLLGEKDNRARPSSEAC